MIPSRAASRRVAGLPILIAAAWLLARVCAGSGGDPTFPSNVYLGPWLVIGPVSAGDPGAVEPPSPEALAGAQAGAAIQWRGQTFHWRSHDAGFLDFNQFYHLANPLSPMAAIAVAAVESSGEGPFALAVGADDGARVWWNGELVQAGRSRGGFQLDGDQALVWVRRGVNHIVMQCFSQHGQWRAAARLLPEGEAQIGVAAHWLLDGVRVNGAAPTSATLAGGEAVARRAIPLASLMPQSPMPALTISILDEQGAARHAIQTGGYGGQWTASLPPLAAIGGGNAAGPGGVASRGWPSGWTLKVHASDGADGLIYGAQTGPTTAPVELAVRGAQSLIVAVRDQATGRPAIGAIVEVGAGWQTGLFIEGRTDETGRCRIDGLPAGLIPIRAAAPGAAPAMIVARIETGAATNEATLVLDSAAPITGTGALYWDDGSTPMAGARLHWTSGMRAGLFAEADDQGEFALRGVTGSVPVTIVHGAFSSGLVRLNANAGSPPHGALMLRRRAIRGRVRDAAGRGLEGAWLTAENIRRERIGGVSGADGAVYLEHNLDGPLTLAVRGPHGLAFEEIPADAAQWEREWTPGRITDRRIRGRVLAADGLPLEGIVLRTGPGERTLHLGAVTASRHDGSFDFGMRFSAMPLLIEAAGYSSQGRERLASRMTPPGEDTITLTIDQAVRQTWKIAVADAATSEPLREAVAVLRWSGAGAPDGSPFNVRQAGPGLFEAGVEWPLPAALAARRPALEVTAPGRESRTIALEALARMPRLDAHQAALPPGAHLLRRYPGKAIVLTLDAP